MKQYQYYNIFLVRYVIEREDEEEDYKCCMVDCSVEYMEDIEQHFFSMV